MTRTIRRRASRSDGTALLEFIVVLPVLLLLMMGIFDFGILFQRYLVVTNAAREGARMAVLPGYSDDDVIYRVTKYARAGGVPESVKLTVSSRRVPIDLPGGPRMSGYRVTVAMPYAYPFIRSVVALIGTSFPTITLKAEATMRTEAGVSE